VIDKERSSRVLNEWFALRVKSGSEKLVAAMAQHKGFEPFLPLHQSRRRWSDRFKTLEVPLFPGYLFCRLDARNRMLLLTVPGVLHFVGIGKTPVPVAESEIAAIQAVVKSGLTVEPWPFLTVGQRVRLEYGPMAGLEGLLIEVRKQHRVVVSVDLLQRSIAMEVEHDWVMPLNKAEHSRILEAPVPVASPPYPASALQ
jgi:transcription antitermination factor NusG